MNIKEILKLIQKGVKFDVEFKTCQDNLTKEVYKTVCSFNNRNGGHIFLGVNDQKEIVGVNSEKVDKIIKEFTSTINNPQKYIHHFICLRFLLILKIKLLFILEFLVDIKYVDIMEKFGIDHMKAILILLLIQSLYIRCMQESKALIM